MSYLLKGKKVMLTYSQWKDSVARDLVPANRIGEDLILLRSTEPVQMDFGPFHADMTISIIIKKGILKININMTDYEAAAPCMVTILPGQTFKVTELPDNMEGDTIIMSDRFSNDLFSEYSAFSQLRKAIEFRPVTSLDGIENAFDIYLGLLDDLIKSPLMETYKFEAAKHLTLSMFYSTVFYLHEVGEVKPADRQSMIFKQFETELKQNYKREREVGFYAARLSITPKYLSSVVLQQTGKSALKVIDEYVVNECQALLLSTSLTVQQISDKLNFPSQAVFSKFFKRMTGISPREYRKQKL